MVHAEEVQGHLHRMGAENGMLAFGLFLFGCIVDHAGLADMLDYAAR